MDAKWVHSFFIAYKEKFLMSFLKSVYNRWLVNRQINACDRMLGQYHAHLGPTHAKEVAQIRHKLLLQRQSCGM